MNDKEELKQIYDIFTDCWRLYKKLYPPGRPEDDVYWQGVVKEIEVLRKNHHHSRLCEDLIYPYIPRIQGDFGKLIDDLIQKCYYENNPYDE